MTSVYERSVLVQFDSFESRMSTSWTVQTDDTLDLRMLII